MMVALVVLKALFDLRTLLLLFQAFAVAFVEMTININNIDLQSVFITATSQLLPLLVGVLYCICAVELHTAYRGRGMGRCESSC